MRDARTLLAAGLLLFSMGARAEEPDFQLRAYSSSPDAPASSLGWRGATRATFAFELPLVGAGVSEHLRVSLLPLLELHNATGSGSKIPHEYWRGRLALWAEWRERLAPGEGVIRAFSLGLGVEHESDHATVRSSFRPYTADFLTLNNVALRGAATFHFGAFTVEAALSLQGYALTCTSLDTVCRSLQGPISAGALAEVVAMGPALVERFPLQPLLALSGSGILPNREIVAERRVVLSAGLVLQTERQGDFQVVFTALAGNEVGFYRESSAASFGLAFRWSR